MVCACVQVKPGKARYLIFPLSQGETKVLPSPTCFYPNPIFGLMLAHPSALALAQEVMSLALASAGCSCVSRTHSRIHSCPVSTSFPDKLSRECGVCGLSPRQGDASQGPNEPPKFLSPGEVKGIS